MADLPVLIMLVGLLLSPPGRYIFASVIPSESQESKSSICDKHKVVCESGWDCQSGLLVFPPVKKPKCTAESSECTPIQPPKTDSKSLEVFCVRTEHATELGAFGGRVRDHSGFLTAIRHRHRRGSCIMMCGPDDASNCKDGELCISNGCGYVCARKP